MRHLIFVLFVLGLLVTGVLGTETQLLFFWPGCLLLGLAGLLAALRWKVRVSFPPSDWCLASVLVLALYLAGRATLSPVETYAREDLFVVLACLTAYVLTVTTASHPRWRLWIVGGLLVLAAGNLAVGFIHFSGHWEFHVVPHFVRKFGEGRIGGFFINSNHLAAFLSYVLFLCAGLLCFGRGGASLRLCLAFLMAAIAIGIALTVSRGALAGLAAGLAVFGLLALWLVHGTHRHLFMRIAVAGVVLAALAGGVLYKVVEHQFQHRNAASPMARDVRQFVWQAALDQHATAPWFGAGARMFYEGCVRHRSPEMPGYNYEALFVHNEFLQLLADYGWVGLGLAITALAAHALNGLRYLHWFTQIRFPRSGTVCSNGLALVLGSLAGLSATAVHAVFEFHWHVAITAVTGALMLGILANPGFEGPEHRPQRLPGVRPLLKVAFLLGSLAMIAGSAVYGRADYFRALADLDEARGDSQAQIDHLSDALAIDSRNAATWYDRGLAGLDLWNPRLPSAQQKQILEQAVTDLKRACTLNPRSFLAWLALADAYDAVAQPDLAGNSIEHALRLAPLYEEPRLALAMHLHRQRRFADAEKAYLWAGEAPARNEDGTAHWWQSYRLLLTQTRKMAESESGTPKATR